MNDTIVRLMNEAKIIDPQLDNIMHIKRVNFEKFAELIVRECIEIADEYDGCGSTIVSRIEKHFGVEE